MTQRQKYVILRNFIDFELREYEPCVIAEVAIEDDYSGATSKAF